MGKVHTNAAEPDVPTPGLPAAASTAPSTATEATPVLQAPAARRWLVDPAQAFTRTALAQRLNGVRAGFRQTPASLRLWFWLAPVLTAVVGGVLRFVRLGQPHSLVFDETYYVKDAYSLLQSGYERNWAEKANDLFTKGDFSGLQGTPEYVVHPPVGKWMIAFGMWLFGPDSSFGWRFSAALVGTLSIFLLALIAQKMFRSTILGAVAGLLFAVDGHAIVQSRTSLLDIFVMFWALVAFGALLLDRDDGRRRLAARLSHLASPDGRVPAKNLLHGPWLGMRWWRLAAGISLGLCTGTKWSGVFFLAAFGVMTVVWDMSARRIAGVRYWATGAIVKDGVLAFVSMVPVAAATYLASWTGWFLSTNGYDRNWAATNPGGAWDWVPASLRSLWHYHLTAYNFHTGLETDHPYKANAWSWLVMGRPTSFYAQYPLKGQSGCTADKCAAMVTSLGNPLIWWCGTLALLFLVGVWAARRDWRAAAILVGFAAGFVPWLLYPERTIFFFYAIAYEPYMILGVTLVLGMIMGKASAPPWRRQQGALFAGIFVVLAMALSAYFYPLWSAEVIPFDYWRQHMWLPSWI
ncbi:dolichyl-phosphate-mannose--protein mannosyltransferase [Arthrobacter sp. SDTb3-6]|uniref:dolichyl-phosphate-mannose--protein mannosyltransferase n=1 Tax=Arthrobacter sp. SDTb3-6 TaxID=2713571 RepID=UPI00159E4F84|nr:phospholipid carrier-dependent glycosyltransferase [Arthrobacter sp. SDTb3-6]NVM99288.1 phospholipid carrier-dependent glycosyltransferase [Arthrobacter sp. SDTb3-6]